MSKYAQAMEGPYYVVRILPDGHDAFVGSGDARHIAGNDWQTEVVAELTESPMAQQRPLLCNKAIATRSDFALRKSAINKHPVRHLPICGGDPSICASLRLVEAVGNIPTRVRAGNSELLKLLLYSRWPEKRERASGDDLRPARQKALSAV